MFEPTIHDPIYLGPSYIYRGKIRSVYDGDTFRADIDLGFDTWVTNEVFRLYGVNTPELRGDSKEKGIYARNYLQKLLPAGRRVLIRTHKDKKEKYGRYLADVYVPENDYDPGAMISSVSERLLKLGIAEKYLP